MIGSHRPEVLAKFYKEVFEKDADMHDGNWWGWKVGTSFLNVGEHSDVTGSAKEPQRIILNLETDDVKKEYERIKKIEGITIVKEPYGMTQDGEETSAVDSPFWIATFADPDGNYLQLMTPWEEDLKN